MRFDRVQIVSVLSGAFVIAGCNAQSPVNSSPGASQVTAGSSHEGSSEVAQRSTEPSQARAKSSPADPPRVAESTSQTEGSAAVGPGPRQDDPQKAGAQSSHSTVPRALAKPSAEQLAKWGMPEFKPLVLLACHDGFGEGALLGMAISPSGKQFVLAGAKLTLWSAKDTRPAVDLLAKSKSDEIERPLLVVAISDDGKWIAAGDQKGRVRIWSCDDPREVLTLAAHPGRITQLAFSPNSSLLATTSYSGDVALWHLPDGKRIKGLKISNEAITHLAFLSDSVLAAASNEVSLWDVDSGMKATALTSKSFRATGLTLSHDRRVLAFNDSDSTAQFWDVPNSRLSGMTVRGAGTVLAAFSHDGKLLATYSSDLTINIWDTTTGGLVQVVDADGDRTTALQWFPKAKVLLVSSLDGRIRMWGTADDARSIGVEPMPLPALPATASAARKSLSSAQFQRVIDARSLPRLPGATPQWNTFGACAYTAPASREEVALFYRYVLGKSGWLEVPAAAVPDGLVFRKDDCELTVMTNAADAGGDKNLQITLHFTGNYDTRWLPKISPIASKSASDSFSLVMYGTKGSLIETEVALLREFHEAGWTAYSRLRASGAEDPNSRYISMLQAGSELTVSIGYPADSREELVVQTSVNVSNKSLPIPPDAGWIEFDNSTDVQLVINTKMDLARAVQFYDETMAAEGWLARDAERQMKEDKAWLPYIRGQQDVLIRLSARPGMGTRIVVGNAEQTSWQLQKSADAKKQTGKPGLEAADFTLPSGATGVKYDVDQKRIEFELADTTPPKLSEQIAAKMEAIGWKRTSSGVMSDEYVLMTFAKGKAEIDLRASAAAKATKAMISGDGLMWEKPLPVAPVPISYETWLRRNRKAATLDQLDEFSAEMHKIQAANTRK